MNVVGQYRVHSGVALGSVALNAFDLFNSCNYATQVFVYKARLDADLLKQSLRRVLSCFPVFAGRPVTRADGKVAVALDDSGVPLTVQESPLTLSDYWSRGCAAFTSDQALTDQFKPYNVIDSGSPPLALRITRLADGASVLGVTHFHGVADYNGLFVLLKAWSSTIQRQAFRNPVFDRSTMERLETDRDGMNPSGQEPLASVALPELLATVARLRADAESSARAVFRIDSSKITAIKKQALAVGQPARWVSNQDLVVSYVWRSIVAARPQEDSTSVSYVIDLRSRYGMGIPQEYVGNATATRLVSVDRKSLTEGPLYSIAELVRAACDRVDVETVGTDLAFMSRQFAAARRLFVLKSILDESGFVIPVNNFSKLPAYEIDLGAGRPVWYGPPENDNLPRLVHVVSTPGGAGVDVHVKLHGEELDRFRRHIDAPETQHDS